MKRSELKQLIREVIQEIQKDWYNMDGLEKVGNKEYYYYAKVDHDVGERDVKVYDIEVYDMDDPANENDTVKQTDDPKVLRYFKDLAKEKYIESKYDNQVFDDRGIDTDREREARADWQRYDR